ncbi:MAG: hypothetical protein RMJ53_10445, partial [Chitinophagales bacterium]|nr:hypothetical protein [Chitinophagales bacterium]MDW8274636.1 hypothetical protein [Chitinophagales bacterium]
SIKKHQGDYPFKYKPFKPDAWFYPFRSQDFKTDDVHFIIPEKNIFDTIPFFYKKIASASGLFLSSIHQLGKITDMMFDFSTLKIKPEVKLPKALEDKAVVVWKNENDTWVSKGGKFEANYLVAKVREFGEFSVQLDTTPPRISPVNITPGKYMRSAGKIIFTIGDNLSGVQDFDTYLDNKWVLSEYDAKTARLVHFLEKSLPRGQHQFKVVVTDERNNQSTYTVSFSM